MHKGSIVVLDFGGQYAHLIARRIRQCGVFSEILPPETPAAELQHAAGIILSGGPQSVYERDSSRGDQKVFELEIPILGICYGLQWMVHALGGEVKAGSSKEYGRTSIEVSDFRLRATSCDFAALRRHFADTSPRRVGFRASDLFRGLPRNFTVWMSHGDEAVTLPGGFERIATSDACANAAIADEGRGLYAVQFHPEVTHTEHGFDLLKNFVSLCDAEPWSVASHADRIHGEIKEQVGDHRVFMLVSGGVDSTVAFTFLNEVLGHNRVQGLLVDTGLMRKNEVQEIKEAFENLGITNLQVEDASDEFFAALKEVYDPEEKRRVVGTIFLRVQRRVCETKNYKLETKNWLLGQGTIYPDTIETGGTRHAAQIKTHHNRIPEIQKLVDKEKVIEPLKDLYKDEVRELGEELGLPYELVWRHPFPGPGLAVRILCTREKSQIPNPNYQIIPKSHSSRRSVGEVSAKRSEVARSRTKSEIPNTILPLRSVGVQGDSRTYRHAVVLFSDSKLPTEEHWRLATEIPNRHPEFNRVLVCLSHETPVEFVLTPDFVTRERAALLREVDAIVDREMRKAGLYAVVWQFPVVLLPVGTCAGKQSVVLRPVESTEAMTANAVRLPEQVVMRMARAIVDIGGIDVVFYDLTDKPPATIEWE